MENKAVLPVRGYLHHILLLRAVIFGLKLLWQQKLCSGRRVRPRCPASPALFAGNRSRSCFLNSALVAWCLEIPLKSQDFQLSFAHLAPPQSTFWAHFLLSLAATQKSLLKTRMIPLLHFSARGDLETFFPPWRSKRSLWLFPAPGLTSPTPWAEQGAALVFLHEVSVTSAVPTWDLWDGAGRAWHRTKASREVFTLMPFPCALKSMFILLMTLI